MAPCYYYDEEEEAYMPLHLEEPTAALRREIVQLSWRLAALHAHVACVNSQVVPTQPPHYSRIRVRNKKIGKPAKPENAKTDQGQQTEMHEKIDKEQQTGASISELKKANRKILEDLLPSLRDRLGCCADTTEEMMIYFYALMADHNLTVRPPLQDAIVLFVVEKYGCENRTVFDEGLKEVFGDQIDEWRSRLHNSLFHTIRMNNIPCFGKKRRRKKSKLLKVTGAPNAFTGTD